MSRVYSKLLDILYGVNYLTVKMNINEIMPWENREISFDILLLIILMRSSFNATYIAFMEINGNTTEYGQYIYIINMDKSRR